MPALRRIKRVAATHQNVLGLVMIAIFVTVFIVRGQGTVHRVTDAVRHANPWWMLGAVVVELVAYWLVAAKYQFIFERLGHRVSRAFLIRLHLERTAIATISPVGSAPAYYVYVRGLRGRGVPIDDALLAATLSGVAGSFNLIATVIFAAVYFSSPILIGALAGAFAMTGGVVGLGVIVSGRSEWPKRWFGRVPERARNFITRTYAHGLNRHDLALPVVYSLIGRITGLATLYLCLRAVGQDPPLLTPVVVSVAGTIASRLSPVFHGLGVVEVAMAGSLAHVGIPAAPALGATFLYRFTSLWLPVTLGLLVQLVAAGALWSTHSDARFLRFARWCKPNLVRLAWHKGGHSNR